MQEAATQEKEELVDDNEGTYFQHYAFFIRYYIAHVSNLVACFMRITFMTFV